MKKIFQKVVLMAAVLFSVSTVGLALEITDMESAGSARQAKTLFYTESGASCTAVAKSDTASGRIYGTVDAIRAYPADPSAIVMYIATVNVPEGSYGDPKLMELNCEKGTESAAATFKVVAPPAINLNTAVYKTADSYIFTAGTYIDNRENSATCNAYRQPGDLDLWGNGQSSSGPFYANYFSTQGEYFGTPAPESFQMVIECSNQGGMTRALQIWSNMDGTPKKVNDFVSHF